MKAGPVLSSQPILEVCVDDVAGLDAAIQGGADRIELCSALSVGGLTPSKGFMDLAGQRGIPVSAMIRPRAGSFVFSPDEVDIMKRDIDAARDAKLTGVVLGASCNDGSLNTQVLETLCKHAEGLDLTLHRAFDLVPDQKEALEAAIALRFSRILTSGGKLTALEGLSALKNIVIHAQGRISIMPGSGVKPETAGPILEQLDIAELHASCTVPVPGSDPRLIALKFVSDDVRHTDPTIVSTLKDMLSRAVAARHAS